MADEAAEFWSDFEKETGEKVEARSIGEFFRVDDGTDGLWGLIVLTDKALRFKHMPSENWLSSLFKKANRSSEPKPVDFAIARTDIAAVNSPKRNLLARLFGPAFPRFTVMERSPEGERRYLFSVDPSSGFLAALEGAAKTIAN